MMVFALTIATTMMNYNFYDYAIDYISICYKNNNYNRDNNNIKNNDNNNNTSHSYININNSTV